MTTHALIAIGGTTYLAEGSVTITELKVALERAVQAGGKFVDVPRLGRTAVSILVSPGIIVTIEERTAPDETSDPSAELEWFEFYDYAADE